MHCGQLGDGQLIEVIATFFHGGPDGKLEPRTFGLPSTTLRKCHLK